ncbi:hydrogenase formation protein HypD [Congregibacter variabilis]|uniref:Hydrogenase maturation factor n=1 Tax=Congregibacter variabilis TaxID=3081200 RepID=A0ABZ0I3N1_9GAMM|nr:hydrogenase formation protein HypD [Congregibacter sp. IMCC43200]
MRFLEEFRDPAMASLIVHRIHQLVTGNWVLMEVCGGQTHSIIRHGIDQLLPDSVELIHGPGCPVCVTPTHCIDEALALATQESIILTTFADMLRVPGSHDDMLACKARGADVRSLYSPLDAVKIAAENPEREVVFFAVGFETTAPVNALSVLQAQALGLTNFSLLVSQVTVPPAIEAIARAPDNRIQAFLAAGHVCTVMGSWQYESLARRLAKPIVITGFEPLDILLGIEAALQQLEQNAARVENQYARYVDRGGNLQAQELIQKVFTTSDQDWRGLGILLQSGLTLNERYQAYDARKRFALDVAPAARGTRCHAGEVLTGRIRPQQCPHFGSECTPDSPLGATMVSGEGACAAYYRYRRAAAVHNV